MVLLIAQKTILALFLAGVVLCSCKSDDDMFFGPMRYKIKGYSSYLFKLLNSVILLAAFAGVALIPFAKSWLWFIIGVLLFGGGILGHYMTSQLLAETWVYSNKFPEDVFGKA